jgi:hypothetical protein
MVEYRVIGSDGHVESSRAFACDTDENAIMWAKQMVASTLRSSGAERG